MNSLLVGLAQNNIFHYIAYILLHKSDVKIYEIFKLFEIFRTT